ncbi:alpha-ketoglutarate-dependent dioxygenase AlkB [Caulobacter segnis]
MDGADVKYAAHVDLGLDPQRLFLELRDEIPWRQEEVSVWGKRHLQPRLIFWMGDSGKGYAYSGIALRPEPWSPRIAAIKKTIERLLGRSFNSVLLNYYRDNRDSMGMHSDDEPELGPEPVIASLSIGAVRTLTFKSKLNSDSRKLRLESGSLLVMAGQTQKNWKHGIGKETAPCGGRINLTFRTIYS